MPSLFSNAILIDTSAVIALSNPEDRYYNDAKCFFESSEDILWVVLNCTKHETYTRARYDFDYSRAIFLYDMLSCNTFHQIFFNSEDEKEARSLLERYSDHDLSFHDALCVSVMKKFGIYRAFSFDRHFYIFGFEVFPGGTY